MSIKRSLTKVHVIAGFFVAMLALVAFSSPVQAQDIPSDEASIAAGKSLFGANCAQCHKLDQKYTGPALRGVTGRRELPWIKSFIKNSSKLIATDADAKALFQEYGGTVMPPHEFLADEEIMQLLAYIENGDKGGDKADADGASTDGGAAQSGDSSMPSEYLTVILVVLVVVLLLILIVLGLIISVLTKFLNDKKDLDEDEKEYINQKTDLKKVFKSEGFILIVTAIVVALIAKTAIDGLYSIGIQQGYAPAQPIAFSHQLHAGQYGIDCQYCHTGVEIGKSANIPSANICMNCHQHIKNVGGAEGFSPEIKKIYDAVENNEPIEWVRIHNLPDLAYFNHSQHVKVGGVECQTCHGQIQEMEVVAQHSPLTMGWCIDCHRTTDVNTAGNAYYDNLVKLHGDGNAMKVADIGGLECAKCHY